MASLPAPGATWTYDAFVRQVEISAAGLLDRAGEGDGLAPVPACPGWSIRDLVAHIGRVHAWAAQITRSGESAERPTAPEDWDELLAWARGAATTLVQALDDTDPVRPTWTFGPQPHVAAFWARRQAHETTMHRWDVEDAVGLGRGWEPGLALDGIGEVVGIFLPRQVALGRTEPLPGPVYLDVDDAPGADLRLGPVAIDGTPTGLDGLPSARLRGSAEDVLLALWGRRPLDALEVSGDPGVIAALRAGTITP